jgi:hypothetical protein
LWANEWRRIWNNLHRRWSRSIASWLNPIQSFSSTRRTYVSFEFRRTRHICCMNADTNWYVRPICIRLAASSRWTLLSLVTKRSSSTANETKTNSGGWSLHMYAMTFESRLIKCKLWACSCISTQNTSRSLDFRRRRGLSRISSANPTLASFIGKELSGSFPSASDPVHDGDEATRPEREWELKARE